MIERCVTNADDGMKGCGEISGGVLPHNCCVSRKEDCVGGVLKLPKCGCRVAIEL